MGWLCVSVCVSLCSRDNGTTFKCSVKSLVSMMPALRQVFIQSYLLRNCDEESDRLKRPSQIGPSDIHNDMPTTRPPRGLPAVLQMAQQLRLSDIGGSHSL